MYHPAFGVGAMFLVAAVVAAPFALGGGGTGAGPAAKILFGCSLGLAALSMFAARFLAKRETARQEDDRYRALVGPPRTRVRNTFTLTTKERPPS